jgi:hypothetical protein
MSEYKRIDELGIPINAGCEQSYPGVSFEDVTRCLKEANLSVEIFDDLFGCQTCGPNGAYPWDVEAVLEKMISGRKTGTQLFWD